MIPAYADPVTRSPIKDLCLLNGRGQAALSPVSRSRSFPLEDFALVELMDGRMIGELLEFLASAIHPVRSSGFSDSRSVALATQIVRKIALGARPKSDRSTCD
jgi:hypothetical protein